MKDPKQAFLEHLECERREKAPDCAFWAFEPDVVFDDVCKALAPQTREDIAAVWAAWHDLFRTGLVNHGWSFDREVRRDPNRALAHMTKHGGVVLEHLRRDPSNPVAYLAHIDAAVPVGTVARAYLAESLGTYGAGFDKATVVLLGCASEALVLELRDAIVAKYEAAGIPFSARPVGFGKKDWQILTILGGAHDVLDAAKGTMTDELRERFEYRWIALADVIRRARNEVGHPTSLQPVTRDDVHALLLLFPESAKLTRELIDWVTHHFTP